MRGLGARARLWAAAIALPLAASACASKPPAKPPASASTVEVQYENNPAPPPAKAQAAVPPLPAFWKDRKDLIQAPPPPPPAALALPKVERFTLKNGLEVVAVSRADLPVVGFSLAVKSGGYDEEKGKNLGVADFTAAMLRRGTETRSADQISSAIDFVGGSLDTAAGDESSSATCAALSKDSKLCLDLLADIMLHPSFPEAEMGEVRDQMLASVAGVFDNPQDLASEHFANQLFGEKHPDGWVLTPEDVNKITRADLVAFWKKFYRPNNAILAVAGDVDAPRLRAELERAFGRWERAAVPARPAFKIPEAAGTRILLVDRPDLTQATMILGHRGIRHADPQWYAVTLMNYVLGGSDFSSRLMTEVRSKRGLTYGIGSSFGASLYEGAFRVSASTKNDSTWEALLASVNEIRRMKAEGPAHDELDKAKGYYAGSTPFSLQTAAGVAASIVGAELHGLGIDYVRDLALRLAAVDDAQAKAAAADFLFPDTLIVVIVGKGDVVEPQLAKTGIRYERINFKEPISYAARARLRKQRAPAPGAAPAAPQPAR
jgi:zinc protease